MCRKNTSTGEGEFNYEKELIQYIHQETNIQKEWIQDVIDCYKMCVEEELDSDASVYLENLKLLTGYKDETIHTIMQTMTRYEEMIL